MNLETVLFLSYGVRAASGMPGPEPAALLLAGLVLGALLLVSRCCNRRGAKALLGSIVVGLTAGSVHAQGTGPDYSQVNDFLNGQRSLLNITDLQVVVGAQGPTYPVITDWITTSNSQQTYYAGNDIAVGYYTNQVRPFSARMFNLPQAVTITPFSAPGQGTKFLIQTGVPASSNYNTVWAYPYPTSTSANPALLAGVAFADPLDSYDDLALSFDDGCMEVLKPNDRNSLSNPNYLNDSAANCGDVLKDIAAGDFAGDGHREIAGLTVLPNGGVKLTIYAFDPQSLTVTPASSLTLTTPGVSASDPTTHVSITRGRFNDAGHDQLAVAFATDSGPTTIEVIDFTPNTLTASEAPSFVATNIGMSYGYFQLKTGQFALPGNPFDQIAYHSSSPNGGGRFFQIVSVDSASLTPKANGGMSYNEYPCSWGFEVGNFDHQQPDPINPGKTEHNPNAEIAFGSGGCDTGNNFVNIYSADPNTLSLNKESGIAIGTQGSGFPTLVATDLQARSMTLGPPTKLSIYQAIQPSVVIGVPPMHIDFVSPNPVDKVPPMVLNLSAVWEGFKSTYEQENSTGKQSSSDYGTSWSFGAQESFSGSITNGDPDEGTGFRYKDTFTAAQKLKGASENGHGTYQGQTFNLSATTGFGDEVSYLGPQFNIWVYPVLGKTVCPAAKPNCQPSEEVPLTIQFSAPSDNALTKAVQGQGVQWYQPPWEPGNIFSYPANLNQLQSIYNSNLNLLTNGVEFLTDSSTITQKTTWAVTTKDTVTTSLNQNYSFENDFSYTTRFGVQGVGNVGANLNVDLSGSFGFSKLIKNTTNLGLSTGVEVSKPGTFAPFQNYGYWVAPYIVGTQKPGGVVDSSHSLSGDVQTFGLLRAMFTADPLADGAGGWWQQAYGQAPDVALNHPSRWEPSTPPLSSPIPSNCLGTGTGSSQMDCLDLSQRSPDNPWDSVFHHMRGFFISSAASPGQGPQLGTANAGDVLTLQARVYNYSLAAMTPDTQVHVRFYFTPWDTDKKLPAGDSVLINEVVPGRIPPFSDANGAPLNWVLVPTTFDTGKFDQTKNGNVSVVFWVLVWMQTSDGNMKSEMPGHGLSSCKTCQITNTQIPGNLKSFADAAKLEECQSDGKCYSNNLGLYKQEFCILPPRGAAVPRPLAALAGTASVNISKVEIPAQQINRSENAVISATLSAGDRSLASVSAEFYDGDPQHGGRLFDVEQVPCLQNDTYRVETLYRTNTCGVHDLFVVVNAGQHRVVRRAPPVNVTCSTSH